MELLEGERLESALPIVRRYAPDYRDDYIFADCANSINIGRYDQIRVVFVRTDGKSVSFDKGRGLWPIRQEMARVMLPKDTFAIEVFYLMGRPRVTILYREDISLALEPVFRVYRKEEVCARF